jgi:hypothetical protein
VMNSDVLLMTESAARVFTEEDAGAES